MPKPIVLLPGWGLGIEPLQPLVAELQALNPQLQVQLEPLPELQHSDLDSWLAALEARLPESCWLGGWSLGGMLATELAARRAELCCGLFTMGTNACFVARSDWPQAMPEATFQRFVQGCREDTAQTLKRFALLCAQGGSSRGVIRQLQQAIGVAEPHALLAALALLEQLDTRDALQRFNGPQLHLLASADALVPAQAALAILDAVADVQVELIEESGHAFVLEQPQNLARRLLDFLAETHDD